MASLNYKTDDGWKKVAGGKTGVLTFKGRAGVVTPKEGDYTAEMVGARPNTWMPNIAEVGGVNPNLLDNWYFGNPVNQRGGYITCPGQSYSEAPSDDATVVGILPDGAYYKATWYDPWWHSFEMDGVTYYQPSVYVLPGYVNAEYTIDRFKCYAIHALLLENNGVVLDGECFFGQPFIAKERGFLPGQTFTFSALCNATSGLRIYYWSTSLGDFLISEPIYQNGLFHYTFTVPSGVLESDEVRITIQNSTGEKVWVGAEKLELGSTQTLAHQDADSSWVLNEIPNYGEELAKCQRYYWKSNMTFISKEKYSDNYLNCNVRFPVPMRAIPSVTIVSFSGTPGKLSDWAAATDDIEATVNTAMMSNEGFNSIKTATSMPDIKTYCFKVVADANL